VENLEGGIQLSLTIQNSGLVTVTEHVDFTKMKVCFIAFLMVSTLPQTMGAALRRGLAAPIGAPCANPLECDSGYCGINKCTDGSAFQPCNSDDDCVSGSCPTVGFNADKCDPPVSESCVVGVDCASGYCGAGFCTNGNIGNVCNTDDDCKSGLCGADFTCIDMPSAAPSEPPVPPTENPTKSPTVAPTQSPTPVPTNPPCSGLGCFCFSARALVDVQGKGPTRMDELKIGDEILSPNGGSTKVYSFGHYHRSTKAPFLQVLTDTMDKNYPLEISQEHLIYVLKSGSSKAKETLVRARELKVGDELVTNQGPSKILSIRTVQREGVYTPFTFTGSLMVNGVATSNYVAPDLFKMEGAWNMMHYLQHGLTAPLRVYASLFEYKNETYDETTGFSPLVQLAYLLEQWFHASGIATQFVVVTILAVPALLAVLMGKMLTLSWAALAVHAVIVIGCYLKFIGKKSEKSAKAKLAEKSE